ncbi:MAG: winged helix-turn-helix domain-containing protein [Myxococcales bacterium]|nr:winged helix-turn-helix domain-containing protein [Myxococcales bacterium]
MATLFETRARRSDPEPSHQAAGEIEPYLGPLHPEVLGYVTEYPGHTAQELADRFKVRDPRTINRRLTELERAGRIERGPARQCSVSKRNAAVWTIGGAA